MARYAVVLAPLGTVKYENLNALFNDHFTVGAVIEVELIKGADKEYISSVPINVEEISTRWIAIMDEEQKHFRIIPEEIMC